MEPQNLSSKLTVCLAVYLWQFIYRSMADVARWMEGMRVETGDGLDREELAVCAERYGRPSVRWLLRFAEKNQLIR